MRKYELMTIFPMDEELAKTGREGVIAALGECGAEIEGEETPFGESRELCYEVKKHKRGRFILFTLKVNPDRLSDLDNRFRLNSGILKYLFVRLDGGRRV